MKTISADQLACKRTVGQTLVALELDKTMLWTLVRKELLDNLLTLRLTIVLIFAVILSVLTGVVGSLDFSRAMDVYRTESRQHAEGQKDITVYDRLHVRFYITPQPLAIFARGASEARGYHYRVSIHYKRPGPTPLGRWTGNDRLNTLVWIDFTGAVALLLSFLAVVLGFDGICGERERGTLGLILTHPLARGSIVVAKLLGGLITLWTALALAFLINLIILMANPEIVFSSEEWIRLGFYFLISCLFLGQVFSLSLMVSCFARNSATALIICLFGWLVGGVGYANILPSISRFGVDEKPIQYFLDEDRKLWKDFNKEMEEWEERNPGPGEAYLKGLRRNGVLRYAHPRGYAWLQKRNEFRYNKLLERTDASTKVIWPATTGPHLRQGMNVEDWSFLSPFANYKILAKQVLNNSLDDRLRMGQLGMRFREQLYRHMQEENLFGSRRWFSDDPEDQEPMIPNPEEVTDEMLHPASPFMKERMAWTEEQEKKANQDPARRLDLKTLPRFEINWHRTLGESLVLMTPGLVVLLLVFGLSMMIAIRRFLRYDPR